VPSLLAKGVKKAEREGGEKVIGWAESSRTVTTMVRNKRLSTNKRESQASKKTLLEKNRKRVEAKCGFRS